MIVLFLSFFFFFFNDTATTEIYTLSLHDALPISTNTVRRNVVSSTATSLFGARSSPLKVRHSLIRRSEEHTSELQSLAYLVCRLLLEKKKTNYQTTHSPTHDTLQRAAVHGRTTHT